MNGLLTLVFASTMGGRVLKDLQFTPFSFLAAMWVRAYKNYLRCGCRQGYRKQGISVKRELRESSTSVCQGVLPKSPARLSHLEYSFAPSPENTMPSPVEGVLVTAPDAW